MLGAKLTAIGHDKICVHTVGMERLRGYIEQTWCGKHARLDPVLLQDSQGNLPGSGKLPLKLDSAPSFAIPWLSGAGMLLVYAGKMPQHKLAHMTHNVCVTPPRGRLPPPSSALAQPAAATSQLPPRGLLCACAETTGPLTVGGSSAGACCIIHERLGLQQARHSASIMACIHF